MGKTPYIGFGGETLSGLPEAKKGQKIVCDKCGKKHVLKAPDGDDKEDETILFYKCGDKLYLGAIRGKLVIGIKPDVSGKI